MDWTKQAGAGAESYQDFLVPAIFEPCAPLLLDAAGVGPGMAVLDVACGTGVVSRAAARRGARVVGVDLGEQMLEVARRIDGPEVDYRQGDATALPVEDASFDVALCQHGLMFFPDRPVAVSEMVRALRPGGTLAVACWSAIEKIPVFAAVARALRDHLGEEPAELIRTPFSVDGDELARLFRGAGLEDVSVTEPGFMTTFTAHRDLARRVVLSGPVAPAFEAAPAHAQQAVCDQTAEEIERYVTSEDEVQAPTATFIAVGRRPA